MLSQFTFDAHRQKLREQRRQRHLGLRNSLHLVGVRLFDVLEVLATSCQRLGHVQLEELLSLLFDS